MDRDQIIAILQEHAPELRATGLAHLRLFGSVARGQATAESDTDVLAEFDLGASINLVTLASLQHRLSTLLGRAVDLAPVSGMCASIRERAFREAVLALGTRVSTSRTFSPALP